MIKRKNLLAIGLGIIMGLAPINVCAAQQEDVEDKMSEIDVIMQTEGVVIDGEFAEELQDQINILEQDEALNEVPGEDDMEEIEELEIGQPEANQEMAQEYVVIDETNFPDAVFKQYVLDKIDRDGDGRLSDVEIENTKYIDVSFMQGMDKINSLKGIEYFTALEHLECNGNLLSSLDISHNLALRKLNCDNNQLRSLDVSCNQSLESLFCSDNRLGNLDVSHNEALADLDCSYNQIISLDVSRNQTLVALWCSDNQLSSLDMSHNEALEDLYCFNNWLSSLYVSHNKALKNLWCFNNQLSSLDVSGNGALEELFCDNNRLSSLNVSHNPALWDLRCGDNRLNIDGRQINILFYDDKFDVGKVSDLQGLSFDGEIFTILDGNKSGTYNYDCGNDHIMTVTISENTKEPAQEIKYDDIEEIPGNWKYESVKYVSERGIMGGVGGSNQFRPDNQLTRAMFATVLYRMAGEPSVEYSGSFSDVEAGKWYSNAIIWANQEGIVSGYSDGSYGINNNITREQIAKMLYLYGQSQGYDVGGASSLDSFTDKNAVSGWAVDYMKWAVNAQMISGKPNGDGTFRLDPKGQATRAECAKMLMMFMENYK